MYLKSTTLITLLTAVTTWAAPITQIPEVGSHVRLFNYEKNENPENIMVFYTRLDASCNIAPESSQSSRPTFDMYWLIDRSSYKPVHPLIKSGIHDHLSLIPEAGPKSFSIQLGDLDRLACDIPNPRVQIQSRNSETEGCIAEAFITLGPSNHNAMIRLSSIYAEVEKTMNPLNRKILAVTLSGTDTTTGEKITRRYLTSATSKRAGEL